jgi:hypothetical protein
MLFELNYSKSKKIDLAHLEKQYEEKKENENVSSISYNPFKIDSLQNYNPIYSLFFEMTANNYNAISLNHSNHFLDLETVYNETTQKKQRDITVHIKYAPLLDPIHYLIGKYEKEKSNLHYLPKIEGLVDSNPSLAKIKNHYNSAYIDCFFCYLSSKIYEKHGILNGIDFYGSYLGIQDKFRMEITDDYEYLQDSPFFMNNKKKMYELETIGFANDFLQQPPTNPPLILGELCDLNVDIDLDNVDGLDVETELEKDPLELIYEKEGGDEIDSADESSTDGSDINESSKEEDDNDGDDKELDLETESEWSDMENSDEPTIYAYIHKFPIQMICLEKCEGTFDSLLENELLEEDHIISALFQVIMTLAAYQKAFSFTHNDLHTNNIVYISTDIEFIEYHYLQKIYRVPTYGKIYKIIDFGRAIYRFQDKVLCSDSFSIGGDAHSQYNFEPFLNKKKARLEPNMSFDLCRLGCSLYDFVFENEDEDVIQENRENWTKIQKLVYEWCTDDNGKNILYKHTGEERYPNFKLYKMIARIVHHHTPENQVSRSIFASYLQTKKSKKNTKVIDIDDIPKYYCSTMVQNKIK